MNSMLAGPSCRSDVRPGASSRESFCVELELVGCAFAFIISFVLIATLLRVRDSNKGQLHATEMLVFLSGRELN